MRHGWLTGVLALGFAFSANAQGSSKLAVGPDAGGYYCPDGRQIWISRCYDQSAQASCQVVHLHIKNNGLNPETAATRAELLTSLKNCALTPLEFGPQGAISLIKPKSLQSKPPAGAPEADTYTVTVPGPKARTALVRVAAAAKGTIIFYADEMSVKPPDKTGLVEAWLLLVYTENIPDHPKARAVWQRYLLNCKGMTDSFETVMYLDQTGELLSIEDAGGELRAITKNSAIGALAGAACKTGPLKGERFATIGAAIKDALTPALTSVAAPGPSISLVNVSANNPQSVYYIDELSVKSPDKKGRIEIWALHVFAKDAPRTPGARASWERYFVICKDKSYSNEAAIDLDRTGKPLKTWDGDHDVLTIPKGSVAEAMGNIACKTGPPPGSSVTTIEDAITLAYPPPPADPATVGTKTPPGPTTRTELFRIGNAANSVWYADAETFDPVPNAVAIVGWTLRVFTKPDPAFPAASAVWTRYHFTCDPPRGAAILTRFAVDRTGKVLKETASDEAEKQAHPIATGSIAEKISAAACYVDYPTGEGLRTVASAIKDAARPQ